ncbi:metallophosphoesterase family protein [Pelobacter seleniigenes]|uniref:metallophosphoesterase family protein n=1 Tax=Pelobacter seleniigenes TaxID=407188 RepID=UPI0004A6C5D8|nr:metallophosphoesterase family protein [Pelobacter seleniigenes]
MSQLPDSLNLGSIDEPLLIFGGPYSNLAATAAMRQWAEQHQFPPRRVICTGDIIAYCGEPRECLELIQDWGIAVVQGNCEQALAAEAPDCGCGFAEGSACSLLSVNWYHFARNSLTAAERAWLATLPRALHCSMHGRTIQLIHGGVNQTNRFLFASSAEQTLYQELEHSAADIVIGGHCGIPWGRILDRRAWLNAGAIGLPANDGTQDGWFMLLSPTPHGLHCRWQRLVYSAATSVEKMRAAGLSGGYAETLQNGLWPSMDVLPALERSRQGIPLQLEDLLIS